jgi:hypothetical protein
MSAPIPATFDGQVFRPSGPVNLPPDTPVELIVVPMHDEVKPGEPGYALWLISQAKLDRPPDWSTNWEKYLRKEDE